MRVFTFLTLLNDEAQELPNELQRNGSDDSARLGPSTAGLSKRIVESSIFRGDDFAGGVIARKRVDASDTASCDGAFPSCVVAEGGEHW